MNDENQTDFNKECQHFILIDGGTDRCNQPLCFFWFDEVCSSRGGRNLKGSCSFVKSLNKWRG